MTAEDWPNCPCYLRKISRKATGVGETTDAESWTHRKVEGNAVFGINRRNSNYQQVRSPRHIALIKDVQVADFVLTFRVKAPRIPAAIAIAAYSSIGGIANFYYVHLGARPDPHSGQIMIVKNAPREAMTTNKNLTPWKNETWHKVKLCATRRPVRSPFILTI